MALKGIAELTGLPSLYPNDEFYYQMGSSFLPKISDPQEFKRILYQEHRNEIPIIQSGEDHLIRVSVQGYNETSDNEALLSALEIILPAT